MIIPTELYKEIKKTLPIACVDLLVTYDKKFLLLKRNNAPAKDQWWFPGGRIFKSETIFQAAHRKGIEELGIKINPMKIVSVEESLFNLKNDVVDIHTINIIVKMEFLNFISKIKIDKFHSDFKWFKNIPPNLNNAVKNPLIKLGFKEGIKEINE